MRNHFMKITALLLSVLLLLSVTGCGMLQNAEVISDIADELYDALHDETEAQSEGGVLQAQDPPTQVTADIEESGVYTEKDDVARYIHLYGHLPSNFISKSQAKEKGWTGGPVEKYCPGCSIGGDRFGNREGLLPKADGRFYTECDIDTQGAAERGAKRIVFSNDGLIYYTEDHYSSFALLYGEE